MFSTRQMSPEVRGGFVKAASDERFLFDPIHARLYKKEAEEEMVDAVPVTPAQFVAITGYWDPVTMFGGFESTISIGFAKHQEVAAAKARFPHLFSS